MKKGRVFIVTKVCFAAMRQSRLPELPMRHRCGLTLLGLTGSLNTGSSYTCWLLPLARFHAGISLFPFNFYQWFYLCFFCIICLSNNRIPHKPRQDTLSQGLSPWKGGLPWTDAALKRNPLSNPFSWTPVVYAFPLPLAVCHIFILGGCFKSTVPIKPL